MERAKNAPRSFGKYLLDRELARGGMARVHLARLRGVGGFEKRLVLKEIDPQLASHPRFITLFVEEANALVAMSHPNIVPVYELGVVEGVYFLTMEHVEGVTLEALVADARLAPEEVAHVGAELADALAYAHERFSLIHRDVTPRNVMIDVHGHARLLDFGIAARSGDAADADAIFGTPGFLSPEQARGEPLSPASDLFSLGALLHRAATGLDAFEANVDATRLLEEPPRLPALEPLPTALSNLIRALLEPDPTIRPSHGKLLASELRAFLSARRPEGVAGALGARAEALARAREPRPDAAPSSEAVTPASSSGPTRSLATSPILRELLEPAAARSAELEPRASEASAPDEALRGPATERIDPLPAPPARPSAPSATREARDTPRAAEGMTPTRGALLLALTAAFAVASAWALSFARFEPMTSEPRPRPVDPTPLEALAPDADDALGLLEAGFTDASASIAAIADAGIAPIDAAEPPRAARVSAPRGPEAVREAREGTLSVQALPWADVLVDGTPIGRTPLRARPIPAGAHTLTLRCPPLGREVSQPLQLDAGERLTVSANLQASPPSISLR